MKDDYRVPAETLKELTEPACGTPLSMEALIKPSLLAPQGCHEAKLGKEKPLRNFGFRQMSVHSAYPHL